MAQPRGRNEAVSSETLDTSPRDRHESTEHLDLEPLPVSALRNPAFEALYQQLQHFNPIQTQVFPVLYTTDDNVLLTAPIGNGKTICAEFAILRMLQKGDPNGSSRRCVYIAPVESLAEERLRDWQRKFGMGLGLRVVELTGKIGPDTRLVTEGQIIISTPKNWDVFSRRWKEQWVQALQVNLFLVDELQSIGAQGTGAILDVIVSRMRYVGSQPGTEIRLVALSSSSSSWKDLGDWIGASSRGLFNFARGMCRVPLENHAYDELRMQAMRIAEPVYNPAVQPTLPAFQVRSHLDEYLVEYLNAEIAARAIKRKEEAVEFLTWTFMYRMLRQNPSWYGFHGGESDGHPSDHLSELIEVAMCTLISSKCVLVEHMEDMEVVCPSWLGRIAAYYDVSCTTIETFNLSLTGDAKMEGLIEILTSAWEYSRWPRRMVREPINNNQKFSTKTPKYESTPHVKANALLQAHFSRHTLSGNLASKQRDVLIEANRLLPAMVEVISNSGWLHPVLEAVQLSQMVTQGLWVRDSVLLQLPHFTRELAERCRENPGNPVQSVFALEEMGNAERRELLQMTDPQLLDVARFCNRYPDIVLHYEVLHNDQIYAGETVVLRVLLERQMEGEELGPVDAPRFPKRKEEVWWLVVGDPRSNQLLAIRQVTFQRMQRNDLEFICHSEPGRKTYTLYFVCDSYLGCDQQYNFDVYAQVEPLEE